MVQVYIQSIVHWLLGLPAALNTRSLCRSLKAESGGLGAIRGNDSTNEGKGAGGAAGEGGGAAAKDQKGETASP